MHVKVYLTNKSPDRPAQKCYKLINISLTINSCSSIFERLFSVLPICLDKTVEFLHRRFGAQCLEVFRFHQLWRDIGIVFIKSL